MRGRLMCADCFHNRFHLLRWKLHFMQERGSPLNSVRQIVPTRERFRILRAMPGEHTDIMQPRRRENHVVIVLMTGSDSLRQRVKPRLVTEFLNRARLSGDVILNSLPKISFFRRHRQAVSGTPQPAYLSIATRISRAP